MDFLYRLQLFIKWETEYLELQAQTITEILYRGYWSLAHVCDLTDAERDALSKNLRAMNMIISYRTK